MSYNPFDKQIGEALAEADLQVLVSRQLSEGYFLEYKRELVPHREKIARSIASFANTYGGWYVVGVTGGEHNVAAAIDGFSPINGNHDPIAVITEAVKIAVQPTPVFHAQVVTLGSGNLVAVVYVPEGQDTPYVTKDGRIYRRAHDSSAPIPESNRYAIDELVRRGEKAADAFKKFASEPLPADGRQADDQSRVCVYISPGPLGIVFRPEVTHQASVDHLLQRSRVALPLGKPYEGISGNLPMDTAQVRQQSVILSQVPLGAEPEGGTSLQLDEFGRCAIRLPIWRCIQPAEYIEKIRAPRALSVLAARAQPDVPDFTQPLSKLWLFDVGEAWLRASSLTMLYLDWLQSTAALSRYDVAVEALNVRLAVPFCDDDAWGQHVEKYGLPVMRTARVRIPEVSDGPWNIRADGALAVHICSMIGRAFGMPTELMAALHVRALIDAAERTARSGVPRITDDGPNP